MNNFNYCPNCGQKVDGNPKFCVKCGKSLEGGSSESNNETSNKKELNSIEAQLIYANNKKSNLTGFLLTLFFGPLGLFYAGSISALIFTAAPFIVWFLVATTDAGWLGGLAAFQIVGCLSWLISFLFSFSNVDDYNFNLKKQIKSRNL